MNPGAVGQRGRRDLGRAEAAAAAAAAPGAAADPAIAARVAAAGPVAADPAAAERLAAAEAARAQAEAERDRAVRVGTLLQERYRAEQEAAAAREASRAAAAAVAVRGRPFTADIIRAINAGIAGSKYELPYSVYNDSLKPSLINQYPVSVEEPPAKAKKDTASGGRGESLSSIKNALKLASSPLISAVPSWAKNRINNLVDNASSAVPALAAGTEFDRDTFITQILPQLNNLALQNTKRGEKVAELAAPIQITRAHLGI